MNRPLIYEGELPAGDRGARFTVWAMSQLVKAYSGHATLTRAAQEAAGSIENRKAQAEAVRAWVENRIRYELDPPANERVCAAFATLEEGYGDCDDQSVVVASMLYALGVPLADLAFVLVATDAGNFSHVVSAIRIAGKWQILETIGRATLGRSFAIGEVPAEFKRTELHPIEGQAEKSKKMTRCQQCTLGLSGLGSLSKAQVEVAAALKVYALRRDSRSKAKLKRVMRKHGLLDGVAGTLGFIATALAVAGPVMQATGGGAAGAGAATGAGGGLISSLFGGGSGVSEDDLQAPNYLLAKDCDRDVLKPIYPPDLIRNYEAMMASASPTLKLRLTLVSDCMKEKIKQAAAQGYAFEPTNQTVFKDSSGPMRGFTLVRTKDASLTAAKDAARTNFTPSPTQAQADNYAQILSRALDTVVQSEEVRQASGDNYQAIQDFAPVVTGSQSPSTKRDVVQAQSTPPKEPATKTSGTSKVLVAASIFGALTPFLMKAFGK